MLDIIINYCDKKLFSVSKIFISIIFVISLKTFVDAQTQCKTPNGDAGTCILLENCQPLAAINKKNVLTPNDLLFLRQASCGSNFATKPKVCCPPESEWSTYSRSDPVIYPVHTQVFTLTQEVKRDDELTSDVFVEDPNCPSTLTPPKIESNCCGTESSSDKIIGGYTAAVDQYPWLALIEYSGGHPYCAGSLISSRYVLTAAHCLGNTRFGPPLKVRLGEYNTTSYPTDEVEVSGGGVEVVTVLIITIEREIAHPGYNILNKDKPHDIGLVKLSRNAPYTDFIRPICLPTSNIFENLKNDRLVVAGWGSNGVKENEVKQYVDVPYVPLDKCQPAHKQRLTENQICAGGEKGRDSCKGDSGGPLMHENSKIVLVGVVSFGKIACGTESAPGIYTNVYKYLDWINKEIV